MGRLAYEAQIVFANANARMELAPPGDDEASKAAEAANRRLFALFDRGWKKGEGLLFRCYQEYKKRLCYGGRLRLRMPVTTYGAYMKSAAFGVRVHSGWAVLVCVSGDPAAPEIVDRRRIVIIEPTMQGAKQPYHFAENLGFEKAERHLQKCAAVSQRLAVQAIREMLNGVTARKYRVLGCAMLLASGRALPSLQKILASHALIHTAEGEFFRKVVCEAFERCRIPVVRIRELELDDRANSTFGTTAALVRQRISKVGKTVGSPWTQDEKTAALAGLIVNETNGAALTPPH
jgi:hypothetical protein